MRREIVAEYPRSREAPSALLALARTVAQRPGSHDEGRLLLERLILEHPRSALVPQARRELDRLLGRVPSGGGG
jgi:TolA-binding protein